MRRGHAAALVMTILAVLATVSTVAAARLSNDLHARRSDEVRAQALWLARSALSAGVSGRREVDTRYGPAVVEVRGGSVEVTLAGATAAVTREPYAERFARGP